MKAFLLSLNLTKICSTQLNTTETQQQHQREGDDIEKNTREGKKNFSIIIFECLCNSFLNNPQVDSNDLMIAFYISFEYVFLIPISLCVTQYDLFRKYLHSLCFSFITHMCHVYINLLQFFTRKIKYLMFMSNFPCSQYIYLLY